MSGSSWIPTADGPLDTFVLNFKTLVVATPTAYGLVSADGTALNNAYTAWHSAFLAATNPTTRSHTTVVAKNVQKSNVLSVFRMYGTTIRANHGVSDELKAGLGLRVPDRAPTPVPPPSTKPVLAIARMEQGFMDVRAADEATPTRRGRPTGSAGLLLYRAVGTGAVADPAQATFMAFVGRPEVHSTFTSADLGKTVTFFGRWTNAKGEVGPWSNGLSSTIAA